MFCGMKALPTTARGRKAIVAHSAGRHRRDSSLPSGKTSSRTRLRLRAGTQTQVFTHSIAVANGNEPGEWISV